MFFHQHPYPPFIPKHATKLIVGTLPPPRFSTKNLKPNDVNFCYGSCDGQLWPILDAIFTLNLIYDNSDVAVQQRKDFLVARGIGICDIVASCERRKIDASDLGMENVTLRNVLKYISNYPKIDTLLFTGGNSKNGPEYFFRKHLKTQQVRLEVVSSQVPRIHQFQLQSPQKHLSNPQTDAEHGKSNSSTPRIIRTVSLTAPSGAANRAVGSMTTYKALKAKNPEFNTFDFRVLQYQHYF